jgi:hypothetical protein
VPPGVGGTADRAWRASEYGQPGGYRKRFSSHGR